MRKQMVCAVLVVVALVLGCAGTSSAFDRGFRGHGGGGFHTRIFIGPGFWWGPGWWGAPYPYYYAQPPVVVQEAPPTYYQQQPPEQQPSYWYYCPNPAGYYPNIKECPPGWMTVVPQQSAPPAPPAR